MLAVGLLVVEHPAADVRTVVVVALLARLHLPSVLLAPLSQCSGKKQRRRVSTSQSGLGSAVAAAKLANAGRALVENVPQIAGCLETAL